MAYTLKKHDATFYSIMQGKRERGRVIRSRMHSSPKHKYHAFVYLHGSYFGRGPGISVANYGSTAKEAYALVCKMAAAIAVAAASAASL